MDFKSVILLLPAVVAVLWGLNYSIYGHLLKAITIPTLLFYAAAANMCMAILFSYASGDKISLFEPFQNSQTAFFLILVMICGAIAWMIMINVVKFVSPTYAAIGEVAYPVFVPLFAHLIFKRNEFDWPTLAGGFFIILGLFIMIYFKSKAHA